MLHDPKQITLFPKLSPESIQQFRPYGQEIELHCGDVLFQQGDQNYCFYIILAGALQITKQVGVEEQLLALHQPGEFTGEISMLSGEPAIATGKVIQDGRALKLEPQDFRRIMIECSLECTQSILTAMVGRATDVEGQLRQQEKLAALGRLSAGLAHELNNPAAAGRRAAQQLRSGIEGMQKLTLGLCERLFPPSYRELLRSLQQSALTHCSSHVEIDPLSQSDLEDELIQWMEELGVDEGWRISPTLVAAGLTVAPLKPLAEQVQGQELGDALSWLESSLTVASLVEEIEQSMSRVSDLVKAIKSYTYRDQAPLQEIDIHQGLDNTLLILKHKLKYGVSLHKEYDRGLPMICAYGSELNQVWTNLIDNAVDAMQGKGNITIRTFAEREGVGIQILDDGPGIPDEIQSRIFDPFFTTKGVGQGTGLGLDIARRIVETKHQGTIRVYSRPGETCFHIWLPPRPAKINELTTTSTPKLN